MDGYFLAVYKELFGLGLNSLDMLIISQVYEYQRNSLDCHATNEQFSEWFGESLYKIERSIKKLSNLNIIDKQTTFISGKKGKDGKKAGNRQRVMKLNPKNMWDIELGASTIKSPNDESWNQHNQVTNSSSNMHNQVTNSTWNQHNQVIKENLKEKSISIKKNQNTEDVDTDAELVRNDNDNPLKKYRTWDECSDEELQEILDEYKEYQESNGTRGLSYNDIAEKYDIKREYINKNNIKNIKIFLFNREQARKTTTYDDDYDLSDLPDFMNTFDEFDIQLYNKQKKIREEQEEESKKKIA